MQTTIPTRGPISWGRLLMRTTAALGLLLVFGFPQPGLAQSASTPSPPPLNFFKNYILNGGNYVVGGVGLRGLGGNVMPGFATGTININGVPVATDVVAAFLYSQTFEKDKSTLAGQNGFFNGFAITAAILGNLTPPTTWTARASPGSPP